jgi:hypothetical protein
MEYKGVMHAVCEGTDESHVLSYLRSHPTGRDVMDDWRTMGEHVKTSVEHACMAGLGALLALLPPDDPDTSRRLCNALICAISSASAWFLGRILEWMKGNDVMRQDADAIVRVAKNCIPGWPNEMKTGLCERDRQLISITRHLIMQPVVATWATTARKQGAYDWWDLVKFATNIKDVGLLEILMS